MQVPFCPVEVTVQGVATGDPAQESSGPSGVELDTSVTCTAFFSVTDDSSSPYR